MIISLAQTTLNYTNANNFSKIACYIYIYIYMYINNIDCCIYKYLTLIGHIYLIKDRMYSIILYIYIYIYIIYIYIYIYCHPQTDCFILSELFGVARQARFLKLGLKPGWLKRQSKILPLTNETESTVFGEW